MFTVVQEVQKTKLLHAKIKVPNKKFINPKYALQFLSLATDRVRVATTFPNKIITKQNN